jgi:hypothetical protein
MKTTCQTLKYKPIRFGWCVKQGDMTNLKRAMELSYTLCGGLYNPIITIGSFEVAASLVKRFHVDVLYPLGETPELEEFIKSQAHLQYPWGVRIAEPQNPRGLEPNCLDIFYPIELLKNRADSTVKFYSWNEDDPLSFLLLASIGSYSNFNKDKFNKCLQSLPNFEEIFLKTSDKIPAIIYNSFLLRDLSAYGTYPEFIRYEGHNSIYIGSGDNFDDLVNYWNLRALAKNIWFYDPRFVERLSELKEQSIKSHLEVKKKNSNFRDKFIEIYHTEKYTVNDLFLQSGIETSSTHIDQDYWSKYSTGIRAPII